jgi:hypothetical protein
MQARDAWMAEYEEYAEGCKEEKGGRNMAAVVVRKLD